MATCKDCLHKCYTEDLTTEETCNFFLDKAEYVPVVRCKDCKQNLGIQCDFIECGYWLDIVKPNGFCSCGERRADI